jgi:putative ABC transport system permease protein
LVQITIIGTDMHGSWDGVQIAARSLRKQPGFTSVVVLSLALAIALNTTMYSVLDALVSPRVDIRRADDVYSIRLYGNNRGRVSIAEIDSAVRSGLSNIEAVAWVDDISGYFKRPMEAGNRFAEGSVKPVETNYFDLLGPKLVAGRTFIAADEFATPQPVVLSEQTVSALFPADVDPVGATVTISDTAFVVVGVLSRYSDFPSARSSAWIVGKPRARMAYARVIRLKPGVSPQDADRELVLIAQRIAIAAGEGPRDVAFRWFRPAAPQFHAARFHYGIGLSVIAVLLVACANLANMQLARGITRRRELALRTALGATRGRIIRHLLTESVLLAVAGLVLGLILTFWGAMALRASIPPAIGAYIVEPQLSWRVLVFALAATVTCVLIVGVAPAVRVSLVDPNEMLKAGAGTGATKHHRRQYGVLVAVEIALALGLLSGASVLVRSALWTSSVMGFDPTPLVYASLLNDPRPRVAEKRALSDVLQSPIARLRQIGGVAAVGASQGRGVANRAVTVSDSGRGVREIVAVNWGYSAVSPGYLRAMGLRVVRGRDFLEGERDEAAVIIDEMTAAALWPGSNPVGALIKFGDAASNEPFVRIVGVAGDEYRMRRPPQSMNVMRLGRVFYLPGPRDSVTVNTGGQPWTSVVVRATGDAKTLPLSLRRAGAQGIRPMGEEFRRERQNRDFVAGMFSLFAALGLGLAAFGVYGVVAHSVAERRRELGVRIALGATSRDIVHAVLRDSVVIALLGIAFGLLGTKYGVRLLGVFALPDDVYNAPLFALAAAFLFAATAASALVPALRATRLDPTESLRCE